MIVCVCHHVSEHEIGHHARAGSSFEDIQFELGVATQCGQCEGCARDVVRRCAAQAVHLHGKPACQSALSA